MSSPVTGKAAPPQLSLVRQLFEVALPPVQVLVSAEAVPMQAIIATRTTIPRKINWVDAVMPPTSILDFCDFMLKMGWVTYWSLFLFGIGQKMLRSDGRAKGRYD
jgi:hypothetical protein